MVIVRFSDIHYLPSICYCEMSPGGRFSLSGTINVC